MHRPAGMAVNNGHAARCRHVGRSPSAVVWMNAVPVAAMQAAAPMQSASNENPSDHSSVCVRSVKNGSIANG